MLNSGFRMLLCPLLLVSTIAREAVGAECDPTVMTPSLCDTLATADSTDYLSFLIAVAVPEPPPFDRTSATQEEILRNSAARQDTIVTFLERNATALKGLFARYDLRRPDTTSIRIDSSDMVPELIYHVAARPPVIAELAEDTLVASLEWYELPPSDELWEVSVPQAALLSGPFPFDTVLVDSPVAHGFEALFLARCKLDRYQIDALRLGYSEWPAICPLKLQWDFYVQDSYQVGGPLLRRVPDDSTCLLRIVDCCGGSSSLPSCTSSVTATYEGYEYRIPVNGTERYLYMAVTRVVGTDTVDIRFDTLSFLGSNAVRETYHGQAERALGPARSGQEGAGGGVYYDVLGRLTPVVGRGEMPVGVRIGADGRRKVLFGRASAQRE